MLRKKLLILFFLAFVFNKGFATHIVGGEIYYNDLGSNNYQVTLKLYRDCINGLAAYDNPASIFIFDNTGTLIQEVQIPFPGSVVLPATINNPCFTPPTNICVEEAVYTTTINLPPIVGGYDITYQRCCRNNTILNIINPGAVGSTYMAHIPGSEVVSTNSSPRYTNFPPIFLCSGVPLNFDHSATDPDGDSLYYELCDPFVGLDATCPQVGSPPTALPVGCPVNPAPPPIAFVPWLAPYNAAYPMSASPALAVNGTTGLMTGTPNLIGQWVVGVCVHEYRNGVLISTNKRDFQFNVVNCPGIPVASIPNQTLFCNGYNVAFSENSLNAFSYQWDFGDPTTTADMSSLQSPSWTYADSGTYTVTLIINPGSLCADTNTSTFYVYPLLNPDFTPPPGECVYENSYDFTAAGAFMGNGTFNWNFGANATPGTSSQQNPNHVVYNAPGTYPVTLTISENGCTRSITHNVDVYPKPNALYGLSTSVACDLQPVQFIDSSQTTDGPLSYQWFFGDGATASEQDPFHQYPSIGNYNSSLIISTVHGCKDTFALPSPVAVYPSPVAGFYVTPTDTSIFYPNVTTFDQSIGGISCTMNWGDGSSDTLCDATHHFNQPGTYELMQVVTNANGCTDTAYSTVLIRPEFLFWIPNAFTPNNSGLNDVFKPVILGVHDYTFMVFDRWGEKIFETHDMYQGWDGYFKGRLCTNDVYVYRIVFNDDVLDNPHEYIGSVTLVR